MNPEEIISARLQFRKLTPQDATAWEEFLKNPEAVKFFPPVPNTKQYAVEWMEKQLKRYENDGYGLFALVNKSDDVFVGQCGFLNQEIDGTNEMEIGYHILPRFWRNGFASEAAIACRDYAFTHQLADSIISIIHPQNFPSQKVAEKNGMVKEKVTVWRDSKVFIYRIQHGEWLNKNISLAEQIFPHG